MLRGITSLSIDLIRKNGLVHHGGEVSIQETTTLGFLKGKLIKPSMSLKGDLYDNHLAERLSETVKYEGIDYYEYATCPEFYALVKVFVDG